MPKLQTTRMSDATYLSDIDNKITDLESAIAAIFGIPLDTEIPSSIFGAIEASGKIRGGIKLIGNVSSPSTASGFWWEDEVTGAKMRLVAVNGELIAYKWEDDAWVEKLKLTAPPTSFEDLDEVSGGSTPFTLMGNQGMVIAINDAGDGLKTINASAAGAQALTHLMDVDDYDNNVDGDKILAIRGVSEGYGTKWVTPASVGSGVQKIDDLNDVDVPNQTTHALEADDAGKLLAVQWDGGVTPIVKFSRHRISMAKINVGDGDDPVMVNPNVSTVLYWGGLITLYADADPGCVTQAEMLEIFMGTDRSHIVFPEPGLYVMATDVTWPANITGTYRALELVLVSGSAGWSVGYSEPPPVTLYEAVEQIPVSDGGGVSSNYELTLLRRQAVERKIPDRGLIYVKSAGTKLQLRVKHDASSMLTIGWASCVVYKVR